MIASSMRPPSRSQRRAWARSAARGNAIQGDARFMRETNNRAHGASSARAVVAGDVAGYGCGANSPAANPEAPLAHWSPAGPSWRSAAGDSIARRDPVTTIPVRNIISEHPGGISEYATDIRSAIRRDRDRLDARTLAGHARQRATIAPAADGRLSTSGPASSGASGGGPAPGPRVSALSPRAASAARKIVNKVRPPYRVDIAASCPAQHRQSTTTSPQCWLAMTAHDGSVELRAARELRCGCVSHSRFFEVARCDRDARVAILLEGVIPRFGGSIPGRRAIPLSPLALPPRRTTPARRLGGRDSSMRPMCKCFQIGNTPGGGGHTATRIGNLRAGSLSDRAIYARADNVDA